MQNCFYPLFLLGQPWVLPKELKPEVQCVSDKAEEVIISRFDTI